MNGRAGVLLSAALAACWSMSLLLPALTMSFGGQEQLLTGYRVLRFGALAAAAYQFGWVANLLLAIVLAGFVGMLSKRALRWAGVLLILASLDTLELFLRPDFWNFKAAHEGYYLWLATMLTAGTIAVLYRQRAANDGLEGINGPSHRVEDLRPTRSPVME